MAGSSDGFESSLSYRACEMEREIAHLDHLSRELKRLLNEQRPVFTIPTECLVMVLDIVAGEDKPVCREGDRPGHLGWIRLGHVCHRIRDVLAGMTWIWARVALSFGTAKTMLELIARAGSAPLTITLDGRQRHTPAHLHVMQQYLQRARELGINLRFFGHGASLHEAAWCLCSSLVLEEHLPTLEKLEIRFPTFSMRDTDVSKRSTLDTPVLREVFFHNCYFAVTAPNLRHFSIHLHALARGTHLPKDGELLRVLARSDKLESLDLRCCVPDLSESGSSLLSLPRLQRIYLEDRAATCRSFWEILQIPNSTRVTIRGVGRYKESFKEQVKFMAYLINRIREPGFPKVGVISLDNMRACHKMVRIVLADDAPKVTEVEPDASETLGSGILLDFGLSGWTEDMSSGPVLSRLLEVAHGTKVADVNSVSRRGALRSVKTLGIASIPLPSGFWDRLWVDEGQRSRAVDESPSLETLFIESAHAQEQSQSSGRELSQYCPDRDLLLWLRRRAASQQGIRRIIVGDLRTRDVTARDGFLAELRAIIPEVSLCGWTS